MSQGRPQDNRIKRRLLAPLSLLLAAALGACPSEPAPAPKATGASRVMMAVTPYHDRTFLERNSAWVRETLATETKLPIELVVTTSYDNTVGLLLGGQVSLASLSPNAYVLAHHRQPKLILLARELVDGAKSYRSMIVTQPDSPLKTLLELKNKKFCFVEPASASGYIYPRVLLRKAGIDPDRDLGASLFTGSHPEVIRAVRAGKCAAGAVGSMALRKSKTGGTSKPLKILAKSAPIPGDAVVMRHDLAPELAASITRGFKKLIAQTQRQEQPKGLKSGGYVVAKDADYDSVRAMARRSGPATLP